jgi:hypothetical protein
MRWLLLAVVMFMIVGLTLPYGVQTITKSAPAGPQFEISFAASVHQEPITGRVFVFITKDSTCEPRLQVGGPFGGRNPFFSADVSQVKPGQTMMINIGSIGYPLDSLKDIPAGDYYVQG